MRIFIYEHITGGGMLAQGHDAPLPSSLQAEGAAMFAALAADFSALGAEVHGLRDVRLRHWQPAGCHLDDVQHADQITEQFAHHAAAADWTVVIAPEFDGILANLVERCVHLGGQLLGPGPDLVKLAADKHATCRHLAAAGIPTPRGRALAPGDPWPADFPCPAVAKPRFGCGSLNVRRLDAPPRDTPPAEPLRLESYHEGLSVSVSLLGGPGGCTLLPPCRQRLADDGSFAYLGGAGPLEPHLARRASQLAVRAGAALPPWLGYIGVDMVLGDATDGRDDVVIEVNPRLTTSYVGLRRLVDENLAAAMLRVAAGDARPLCQRAVQVEFDSHGGVVETEVDGDTSAVQRAESTT